MIELVDGKPGWNCQRKRTISTQEHGLFSARSKILQASHEATSFCACQEEQFPYSQLVTRCSRYVPATSEVNE